MHGDKKNVTPLSKEKTMSQWINLSSSKTPSRSELARQTHKLRIQAAKNNATPLGIERTPSHMSILSRTPNRSELARDTHLLRIQAARNNADPLGIDRTPSQSKFFSKTPSRPELARQTHKLRIQAAQNNTTPRGIERTPLHLKIFPRSIISKTPSRPEFRSVAAIQTPSLSSAKTSVSTAIYKPKKIFERGSREECKNGVGDKRKSHITRFRSKNLASFQNRVRASKNNMATGLFTSPKTPNFTDPHISIQESFSTDDEAKHDDNENGNREVLGGSVRMGLDANDSTAASFRSHIPAIEMMHVNDKSAQNFPIDQGSPSTAENTLHPLNQTFIIRNSKRFRPSSNLVHYELDLTNNMQTGTFEPNETSTLIAEPSGYSIISNTPAKLIESVAQGTKKPTVSLWPSIETCRERLQTVRDFSLPAFLRAQCADPPCDCCLCKFTNKNNSLTVKYCIKHPIQVRKCGRNAPYAQNYRKTVLCNACRLSLNDRISKKSKGKFKCYHADCRQVFNTKSAVISHVMDHMNLRNYPCEVCPNKFKSLSALKTHARKHLR